MPELDTFRRWFEKGKSQNARYMMVYCDTFDYGDYPVYVKDAQEYFVKKSSYKDRLMEVYDLSMDMDEQISEKRAYHPPQ